MLPTFPADQLKHLHSLREQFLAAWPISSLSTMTLDQYTNLKKDDAFTYWVEARVGELGSIWGHNVFKFGISAAPFRASPTSARSSRTPRVSRRSRSADSILALRPQIAKKKLPFQSHRGPRVERSTWSRASSGT